MFSVTSQVIPSYTSGEKGPAHGLPGIWCTAGKAGQGGSQHYLLHGAGAGRGGVELFPHEVCLGPHAVLPLAASGPGTEHFPSFCSDSASGEQADSEKRYPGCSAFIKL